MNYPHGYKVKAPTPRKFNWLMRSALGRAGGMLRGVVLADGTVKESHGGALPRPKINQQEGGAK